jgi:hypothetical protein
MVMILNILEMILRNNKTIASNSVLKLAEDKNGNIWAGLNEKGISCYDPVLNDLPTIPLRLIPHRKTPL